MEKAYIILAHKNHNQLKRLIERLDDGTSHFFVHIDKESSMQQHRSVFEAMKNTQLVSSVRTEWGNFGLVEATLKAMDAVKNCGKNVERIILLSGQDYPIKSNDYINNFLQSSKHSVFMDHYQLPDYKKWASGGGSYRINKYFFGFSIAAKYRAKTINFLSTYIKVLQRKLRKKMTHYYGSQWWIIDKYTLNYILDFVANNPDYSAFHRNTFAPDELFFQTIVINAKDEKVSASIINNNVRFMKWADNLIAHPEILRQDDFDEIVSSPALFARKFDAEADLKVLEMIDEKCL
ncbi:MAG: putative glycosyl transferase [Mucilaginibacter sp.]|nr:putative glycosyl transferase [Mucilaginibacter sp.]